MTVKKSKIKQSFPKSRNDFVLKRGDISLSHNLNEIFGLGGLRGENLAGDTLFNTAEFSPIGYFLLFA